MNAGLLLAYFNRISDAPDAVLRLRRFILDLAVRGKLVEQEPCDEPVLNSLNAAATGSQSDRFERGSTDSAELPFRIPKTWSWLRIDQTAHVEMGQSPSSEHYNQSGVGLPFYQGKTDFGRRNPIPRYWCSNPTKVAFMGDILLSVRAPVGPTNVANETCCIGRGLAALRPHKGIMPDYFLLCLQSFEPALASLGFGTTFVAINKKQLVSFLIPIPRHAEQFRIVAKVDELMALCDRLEAAQRERESRRDLFAASIHHHLNNGADAEALRSLAQFFIGHLPRLTARPDQIKHLRQTIFGLAVRGKLSTQDSGEEPASSLLEHIERTKRRLYVEKKIPKSNTVPAIETEDIPYEVPSGWEWARLGMLCYQVSDGPHFSPHYVSSNEGIPFLSTRNVRPERFDLSSVKYVSRSDHELFCKRVRPEKGDVLYTKGGTTGIARVNDLDFEFSVWVHLAVLKVAKELINPHYIALALNSPLCYKQSQAYTQGISNFDLGLTRMIKILLPLPPAHEQSRIVSKVYELMALCNRLEARLGTAQTEANRLLESVLDHVLNAPAPSEIFA